MPAEEQKARIGVLGASGYTGAELVRLLSAPSARGDRAAHGRPPRRQGHGGRVSAIPALRLADAVGARRRRLAGARLDLAFWRAAARHDADRDQGSAHARAGHQGRRPLGRFPLGRSGCLCALVRTHPRRAGAAKGSGLRPDRSLSPRDQGGAARCQSRLLHELRGARADPAVEGEGDRSRRDRHRRQIGRHRSGQGGARGYAVRGSVRRLSRLRRRPPPPHGRARPGIFLSRRPRGDRQLHAASRADEPRYPLDHLRPRPQSIGAGPSCFTFKVLREGAVRACAAVRRAAADPPRARLQHDLHRHRGRSRRRPRHYRRRRSTI